MAPPAVTIAGAGIAGLTAALSFAARGFSVTVFERAERLEEVGAGLQLSPNATRILARLGVLETLLPQAVAPEAIVLKDAATLATLAKLPVGRQAEGRWGAPYLVAHRADLQGALLRHVGRNPAIRLETGAEVLKATFDSGRNLLYVATGRERREVSSDLLVGSDGVWSRLRPLAGGGESRFTGHAAFRAVLRGVADSWPRDAVSPRAVTAFLAPGFHLVAYPLNGGADLNLVAVTPSAEIARGWAMAADVAHLRAATARAAPALSRLVQAGGAWTAWPIHEVAPGGRWTRPEGLALIGDAAHALTPYAAQGAAMAMEDAALLASLMAGPGDTAAKLSAYERVRKPRLGRVAARGRFNRFVWHVGGPAALARNLALRLRSEQSLLGDLDWLYGYDVEEHAPPT